MVSPLKGGIRTPTSSGGDGSNSGGAGTNGTGVGRGDWWGRALIAIPQSCGCGGVYKTECGNPRDEFNRSKMNHTGYLPLFGQIDSPVLYFLAIAFVIALTVKLWPHPRDPRLASLPPHVPGWPTINQTFVQQKNNPTWIMINCAQKYDELFRTTRQPLCVSIPETRSRN